MSDHHKFGTCWCGIGHAFTGTAAAAAEVGAWLDAQDRGEVRRPTAMTPTRPTPTEPTTAAWKKLRRWLDATMSPDGMSASQLIEAAALVGAIEAQARAQVECPEVTLEVTDDEAAKYATIVALREALADLVDEADLVPSELQPAHLPELLGHAAAVLSDSTQPAEEAKRRIEQPWRKLFEEWAEAYHDVDDSPDHRGTQVFYRLDPAIPQCQHFRCDKARSLLHDTSVTQEPK